MLFLWSIPTQNCQLHSDSFVRLDVLDHGLTSCSTVKRVQATVQAPGENALQHASEGSQRRSSVGLLRRSECCGKLFQNHRPASHARQQAIICAKTGWIRRRPRLSNFCKAKHENILGRPKPRDATSGTIRNLSVLHACPVKTFSLRTLSTHCVPLRTQAAQLLVLTSAAAAACFMHFSHSAVRQFVKFPLHLLRRFTVLNLLPSRLQLLALAEVSETPLLPFVAVALAQLTFPSEGLESALALLSTCLHDAIATIALIVFSVLS